MLSEIVTLKADRLKCRKELFYDVVLRSYDLLERPLTTLRLSWPDGFSGLQ